MFDSSTKSFSSGFGEVTGTRDAMSRQQLQEKSRKSSYISNSGQTGGGRDVCPD